MDWMFCQKNSVQVESSVDLSFICNLKCCNFTWKEGGLSWCFCRLISRQFGLGGEERSPAHPHQSNFEDETDASDNLVGMWLVWQHKTPCSEGPCVLFTALLSHLWTRALIFVLHWALPAWYTRVPCGILAEGMVRRSQPCKEPVGGCPPQKDQQVPRLYDRKGLGVGEHATLHIPCSLLTAPPGVTQDTTCMSAYGGMCAGNWKVLTRERTVVMTGDGRVRQARSYRDS